MSRSLGLLEGGQELWIIGKNFLKDTRVVFTFTLPGKEEPTWTKVITYFFALHYISKEFFIGLMLSCSQGSRAAEGIFSREPSDRHCPAFLRPAEPGRRVRERVRPVRGQDVRPVLLLLPSQTSRAPGQPRRAAADRQCDQTDSGKHRS